MSDDEFGIIAQYFQPIANAGPGVKLGPGDDCAVIAVSTEDELCVSTDTLIAGVHFPDQAEGDLVANRCFGASVSDLAAMGALPLGLTVALTMPSVDHDWLASFAKALDTSLKAHDMSLIGGNLASGTLSLTMTVFGEVPAGGALRRSGAQPGDDVYVSGTIGDAGAGLQQALAGEREGFLATRYCVPQPRCTLGVLLRPLTTAMIDISDGLIADAAHIASASECTIEIDLDKVPFSDELQASTGFDRVAAVTAGDDYELCFTAPTSVRDELACLPESVTRIGRVTAPSQHRIRLLEDGSPRQIEMGGYNHFGDRDES